MMESSAMNERDYIRHVCSGKPNKTLHMMEQMGFSLIAFQSEKIPNMESHGFSVHKAAENLGITILPYDPAEVIVDFCMNADVDSTFEDKVRQTMMGNLPRGACTRNFDKITVHEHAFAPISRGIHELAHCLIGLIDSHNTLEAEAELVACIVCKRTGCLLGIGLAESYVALHTQQFNEDEVVDIERVIETANTIYNAGMS